MKQSGFSAKPNRNLLVEVGKTVKREYSHEVNDEDLKKESMGRNLSEMLSGCKKPDI